MITDKHESFESIEYNNLYGYVKKDKVPISIDFDKDEIVYAYRYFVFVFVGTIIRIGKKRVGYSTREEAIDSFKKYASVEGFKY